MLRPFTIVESASAAERLRAAAAFLRQFPPDRPLNIVAATRGAADDLARSLALERGATFGLARYSLLQFAARVAITRLAGRGVAPSTALGAEAVSARASFDAAREGSLRYLSGVADTPGFPRALARTLHDVRSGGVAGASLAAAGRVGHDLAWLLARVTDEFAASATADRTSLLQAACDAAADDPLLGLPLLLLDVPADTAADAAFLRAVCARAETVCATVPAHDASARDALVAAGGSRSWVAEQGDSDIVRLRQFLFADDRPPQRSLDGSLEFFSAPGEGRESVEIARRILAEARRGVPFDEMAVLVRSPRHYQGLLEHALERAQVPAWFDRGTRRPHPAGRAFLALLACAAEGLSANRFAEYLSLGQIPRPDASGSTWAPPVGDDIFGRAGVEDVDDDAHEAAAFATPEDDEAHGVTAGTLVAPRRWERLLVEAAVIGGNPARWERRLDGLAAEFRAKLAEENREEPASPRAEALERDLQRLAFLRSFSLPLVQEMADWPTQALWGAWLDRLAALAPRVLRVPAYVLRVLGDLRPMAAVGPVTIDEVRGVLAERLITVDAEPPSRRYGRVFVGSPAQARGRSFRVVFVPGLAERVFPQKPQQDPLLLDRERAALVPPLPTRDERNRHERLLLHLAAGAARERLYVSYPRIDVAEARPRVPSFYALDLYRGATGQIPDHEALAEAAAKAGDRSLAWPAPISPDAAIDDQEHDLAVLRELLDARDPNDAHGRAQYLLRLNPALRRSVTERWARGERRWSRFDGIISATLPIKPLLNTQRLSQRPYSLSALQKFSACPYQFLLSAVYRLSPAESPQPLQRLDPLTKGSLVHRIQAVFFRRMHGKGALPITEATRAWAAPELERAIADVSEEYRERFVPAIPRVWRDEVAAIARDLRGWLDRVAADGREWVPRYFELAFGLPADGERDPASSPVPVTLPEGHVLRGSVDLVEEHRTDGSLRVTDHKTGKNRHDNRPLMIGGGAVLQPVVYSLVVERLTGRRVAASRLSFCTTAGGFSEKPVELTQEARRLGIEALEVIDRAVELGALAAAPRDGACAWCDYRPVCGPNEEERVRRKPADRLADLAALRSRP